MNAQFIKLPDPNCWIVQSLILPKKLQVNDSEFEKLWNLHPPMKSQGELGGKQVNFHRYTASCGNSYDTDYKFDINSMPLFRNILDFVRNDSDKPYNELLINWYEDGNDYIGYHNDKGNFIPGSSIYSFTYGQERDFYIRPIRESVRKRMNIVSVNPDYHLALTMPNNSLIIMGGYMQKYYEHSVPKRTSKRNPLRQRVNITLRLFSDDK